MKQTLMALSVAGQRDAPLVPVTIAAVCTAAPGLIVHRRIITGDDGQPTEGRAVHGWQITHTASGLTIGGLREKKRDALDLAARLAPLADWTQNGETIAAAEGFQRVRDVLAHRS